MEYNKTESVMKAAEDAFPEATVSVVSHRSKSQDGPRRYSVVVDPVDDPDALKKVAEDEGVVYELDGERARLHGAQ